MTLDLKSDRELYQGHSPILFGSSQASRQEFKMHTTRINLSEIRQRLSSCQTPIQSASLWNAIFCFLDLSDHCRALETCTEWFVYSRDPNSWCTTLTVKIKRSNVITRQIVSPELSSINPFNYRTHTIYLQSTFGAGTYTSVDYGYQAQDDIRIWVLWKDILHHCKNLKRLFVHCDTLQLNDETFNQICNLEKLETFDWYDEMSRDPYRQINDFNPISKLKCLKEIPKSMMLCFLKFKGMPKIAHLALEKLYFKNNTSIPLYVQLTQFEAAFSSAKYLSIESTIVIDQVILDMTQFSNLTHIHLYACTLSSYGLSKLFSSGLLLTSLELDSISIVTVSMDNDYEISVTETFQHLSKLSTLTSLSMRGCDYMNVSVMSEICKLIRLKSLDLSFCNIQDKMCQELTHLHNIQTIDLSDCTRLTPDGVLELKTIPTLREISVKGCFNIFNIQDEIINLQTEMNQWRKSRGCTPLARGCTPLAPLTVSVGYT